MFIGMFPTPALRTPYRGASGGGGGGETPFTWFMGFDDVTYSDGTEIGSFYANVGGTGKGLVWSNMKVHDINVIGSDTNGDPIEAPDPGASGSDGGYTPGGGIIATLNIVGGRAGSFSAWLLPSPTARVLAYDSSDNVVLDTTVLPSATANYVYHTYTFPLNNVVKIEIKNSGSTGSYFGCAIDNVTITGVLT